MSMQNKSKAIRLAIIILSILLLVSIGAVIARVLYLRQQQAQTQAVVSDNNIEVMPKTLFVTDIAQTNHKNTLNIGTTQNQSNDNTAGISLYSGKTTDNKKFEVTNMLPGDSVTKYFELKLHHNADIYVYFKCDVSEQAKSLADVLNIKITNIQTNNLIYSGTFADMSVEGYAEKFVKTDDNTSTALYKIEAYLDTSVGNEYQSAYLLSDFIWFVKDSDSLDSPVTGDIYSFAFVALGVFALLILTVLLLICRRGKEDSHAKQNP